MRHVVLVTTEPLGATLAGPAIRAVELARVLAAEHEVLVATTSSCDAGTAPSDVRCVAVDSAALVALASTSDVLVLAGDVLARHRELASGRAALVVDLYDPFHLEQLEQSRDLANDRRRAVVAGAVDALNAQAILGDTFLCASPRQRDLWLGHLAACGRVNPATYDDDPGLRRLLRMVPFGVSADPPRPGEPVLRGVVEGIRPDDDVVMWGGGIYNWFDPQTLIRAVDLARRQRPNLRLVFMGAVHPNPEVATMRAAVAARELSAELGLTGVHVFFSDSFASGWVPYEERGRYLAEATLAVSTHHDHIETEFSFRTRMLDYFWAGLPVVTTKGDALADVVAAAGAGVTVEPGDVDGLAQALVSLLGDASALAAAGAASAELAQRYRWPVVAEPLLEFCRAPYRAPDLADPVIRADLLRRLPPERPSIRARWTTLRRRMRDDGFVATVRAVAAPRLRRLSRRPAAP